MILTVAALDHPSLRHGFCTREGGVSEGIYASLNCGFGSGDDVAEVAENRRRALAELGLGPEALVTGYQVHGDAVALVETPWRHEDRPHVDGLVTRRPGIALGILTADCAPVLFADAAVPMVAAAHAGWRGAVGGVLEATLAAMERQGAARGRITAAIGPCIGAASYEVGAEFPAPFPSPESATMRGSSSPRRRPEHFLFDLAAYVAAKLARLGVHYDRAHRRRHRRRAGALLLLSPRLSHMGEKQFGHLLSLIAIAP